MSTRTGRTAVVAGGGIGGLATALALQRSGWQVSVRERSHSVDRGGAGLVLWPNALRCLAALGLEDAVRERATSMTGSAILRPDGRRLSTIAADPRSADRPVGIVRADLVEALAAGLGAGVIRFDDEVRDPATLDADLVVGADGLRSVVRRSLDATVEPEHRGYTVWRALLPVGVESWGGRAELRETWGGGGLRFGMVPAGPTSTYVYAAAPAPAGDSTTDELPGLRERFGRWHDPVPALLAAMESVPVLRHDIYDLPPGRTPLHRGHLVLVGDAAHAMEPNLGQGAGLALEDAVVLDHALATNPSVDAALVAYSRLRTPRVVGLARQSRRVGQMVRLERPGVLAMRDLALRATPDWLARRGASAAVGWRPPLSATPEHQEIR